MQKIHVSFLKPDMIVAKTIYTTDGKVLISEGLRLKENYISKLMNLGISEIYIKTQTSEDITAMDVIKEQNRLEAQKIMKHTMDYIQMGKDFSTKPIIDAVHQILDDLLTNDDIMINLCDIKAVDDYTFGHSVNVCVLSIITGIAMGFDVEDLTKLGVGAILHDIGKLAVPQEILNKPSALTAQEYGIMKEHSSLGYDIAKKYPKIDPLSALVILEHHERYDGQGYPFGREKNDIHVFSKIVAVADVYDALTSDRVYKKKAYPHEAIEYLVAMGNHQFDYEIVKQFTAHVASYPTGTFVMLSTGEKGIVIGNDKNYPHRPRVRCIRDSNGGTNKAYYEIELIKNPNISIVKVIQNME